MKIGINNIDQAVIKAMVTQAKLNLACLQEGTLKQYCCACRGEVLQRGARPGKDLQDSRWKLLEDKWDGRPEGHHAWIRAVICEPCNKVYFEKKKWTGAT